jgi:multidrug efflux pump subunit AcrB
MGFTLNLMTMLALTLSVGIVIDMPIRAGEHLPVHRREHDDQFRAAIDAVQEIALVSWPRRCRWWRFSCRSGSRAASSEVHEGFGLTMAFAIMVSLLVSHAHADAVGAG